jgi:peptidoglycan/LPS O-acetylase OafA/YrhL
MESTTTPRAAAASSTGARAHRVLALVFLAGAVVQFFLAGLGAFGGTSYDAHRGWGDALTVIALVLLILAFTSRREAVQPSAVLFGLMVLQVILGGVIGTDVPVLAAFHPVVGLAVLGAAMASAAGGRMRFGPPHGADARRTSA